MRLSILVPCLDLRGTLTTLQSLFFSQADALQSSEILVIGPEAAQTELGGQIDHPSCRFLRFPGVLTAAHFLDVAIGMASYQHVLCVQPDCLLGSGVIARLLEFYNLYSDADDLFQGPLISGQRMVLLTDPWQVELADISEKVVEGVPFQIKMQDLGVFSCRRDAWPGTQEFRTFDGSGYVHERFAARGSKCVCLPWFKWSRPLLPRSFSVADREHDLMLWQLEPHRERLKITPGCDHLISCILVVGDASDHALNECVESFRRQTYPNRELIIINDRPDRRISVELPLVRVVNDSALDNILAVASGDLICFWPPDRIAYPSKLSMMLAHLEKGCSSAEQCTDGFRRRLLPPTILTRRELVGYFPPVPLETKLSVIQDICADTTHLQEDGPKSYRLAPLWSTPACEKFATIDFDYPKSESMVAFLLMYNLLDWPLKMIEKLRELAVEIVFVDQCSTYPPLLDYYRTCDLRVHPLIAPVSRLEFVSGGIPAMFCRGDFYLVFENDLDISGLPNNIVQMLIKAIYDYGGPAVGLTSDPVDGPRWDRPGKKAVSPITIYQVDARIQGIPQKCIQVEGLRHLPSELDVAEGLNEELLYYLRQRLMSTRAAHPRLVDRYLSLVEQPGDDV